jgi:SAM-dependent methyltransferase
MNLSKRKQSIKDASDRMAIKRLEWKKKNYYFHEQDIRYLSFLIPEDSSILDLGCGVGDIIASLKPSRGVGIDISDAMTSEAKRLYPEYEFITGDIENSEIIENISGTFDYILLSDTIGYLADCQSTLTLLHKLCKRETRIIVSYYSYLWEPVLKLAELLKLKMPQRELNFLTSDDLINLMSLSDFEVVKREWQQLIPRRLWGIGTFINRFIATLPYIRKLCVRNFVVGRSLVKIDEKPESCTIVIPCRNEKGNIEQAIMRIPNFCDDMEIIFVEGHSQDGTFEEIKKVISQYPDYDIKSLQQDGKGKADAVYKGFEHARGEVLMILDADLTMPPEQLTKFWHAISTGQGEYINGSRLVYPMEKDAMRFLNLIANHAFSIIFSWLLNQRYTDTLCGTKVLRKSDYENIRKNRSYFGDFDPFGDFDLIFGSSKLNLKTIEIPIIYKARSYGDTQISRFRHGMQLFRMVLFGYHKLKAF